MCMTLYLHGRVDTGRLPVSPQSPVCLSGCNVIFNITFQVINQSPVTACSCEDPQCLDPLTDDVLVMVVVPGKSRLGFLTFRINDNRLL